MEYSALLVAGGIGTRMGTTIPKQFLLLNEIPVLAHTIRQFWQAKKGMSIVVVMHSGCLEDWETLKNQYFTAEEKENLFVCKGGETRIHSVYNGLLFLKENIVQSEAHYVAIHDAVRPFATKELISNCFETAVAFDSAVPCVPVKSSLRKIEIENGKTTSYPVKREEYLAVQTPQTFRFSALWNCFLERTHDNYTDDASLYQEITGLSVAIVTGEYENIKITTPEDLLLGERILKTRS